MCLSFTFPRCDDLLVENLRFFAVFAARCYASAALAVMRCPSVCVSVCQSRSYILSKRINVSSFFSLSASSILVFLYQTAWQYFDGNPLTAASNAGRVCRNRDSEPISLPSQRAVNLSSVK